MIKVRINGKEEVLSEEMTIAMLLEKFSLPCKGMAVAIDGTIIPQVEHKTHKIADGDNIELIRAVGGG